MSVPTILVSRAFRDDTAPTNDSRMVVVPEQDGARFIVFDTDDQWHFCCTLCMYEVLEQDYDIIEADPGQMVTHRYYTGNRNHDGTREEHAIVVSWARIGVDGEAIDGRRCDNEHCGDFL